MNRTKINIVVVIALLFVMHLIPVVLIHIPSVQLYVFQQVGFIPNSIDAIFYLYCGIIVGIGYLLGWSYQQTSVYVCIYLWPVLLGMSSLPILYNSIKNALRKKTFGSALWAVASVAYTSLFGVICKLIWEHYNQLTIQQKFSTCMNDLIVHAEKLNMSYNELNLLFYIVLFAAIVVINGIIAYRQRQYILRTI